MFLILLQFCPNSEQAYSFNGGFNVSNIQSINQSNNAKYMPSFVNFSKYQSNRSNQPIHVKFSVKKKISYGEAIYVCGDVDELGLWRPQKALKLQWNEGDLWTGFITLTNKNLKDVEYKYFIDRWNNPLFSYPLWQVGQHNRKINLITNKTLLVCNDIWNIDVVNFVVGINKTKNLKDDRYYLIGQPQELGNWKEKKILKKINSKLSIKEQIKQNNLSLLQNQQLQYYFYSFKIFRSKSQIKYQYLKRQQYQIGKQNHSRSINLDKIESSINQTNDTQILYINNEIFVIDHWRVNQMSFSQVTPQIYVGSYIKSMSDVKKLKQKGIACVLAIQSDKDFVKHGLSSHYCRLICSQYQINYKTISIDDMSQNDFINKSYIALKVLADLLKRYQKVYVHCSAGIFRSTQLISLYLTVHMDYSISQSINLLQRKHQKAKPNHKILTQSLKLITKIKSQKSISI